MTDFVKFLLRGKFIRAGYVEEQLKIEIEKTLETLIKYQIIDKNYIINENLNSK
ncbi:hypothetical protein [Romboutsia sp.]|uniref:hypothetical protein n=1 Tax=Romboutsia sp. TaxID=1965302 RepID=UPI003F29FB28